MGVDITLTALRAPDMPAIRAVLDSFGLTQSGLHLSGPRIDAHLDAFETSWLGPGARGFYGQLFGVRPHREVCALLFALAGAGPLLMTCSPGPPHIVVRSGTFDIADVTDESVPPWLEVVCVVSSPAELADALGGTVEPYRSTFADRYWY